jgi:hypothetical protein
LPITAKATATVATVAIKQEMLEDTTLDAVVAEIQYKNINKPVQTKKPSVKNKNQTADAVIKMKKMILMML